MTEKVRPQNPQSSSSLRAHILALQYPDILGLMHAIVNRDLPKIPEPFPDDSRLTRPNGTMLDLLSSGQITSFIIDAEVVALDKDTGAFRTFQDLSNRAKKDVKVEDIKVIVGVFSFDLMLLNDQVREGASTSTQNLH